MGNDEADGSTVIGGERGAVMFEGEKYVRTLEILQGDVGGVALFGEDENEFSAGLQSDALENFSEEHTFPEIVETAPAGDAVKVAGDFGLRKCTKLVPGKADWFFH